MTRCASTPLSGLVNASRAVVIARRINIAIERIGLLRARLVARAIVPPVLTIQL
jgi:hypothetical protein